MRNDEYLRVGRTAIGGALLALLTTLPAHALDLESLRNGNFQIHGFASQGYVVTDGNNNVNGDSSSGSGSFDFNEIGINTSWRPYPELLIAAQAASVRTGQTVDEDIVLEYGLVDYKAWQGSDGYFGWRLGKLKTPFGFYNDSRDIVFSRPSILLPQGVYLDTPGGRNFGYFALDGIQLYGGKFIGRHDLTMSVGLHSDQDIDNAAKTQILPIPVQQNFSRDGRIEFEHGWIARLMDEIDGGAWRAALTLSSVSMSYLTGPNDLFMQDGGFEFDQAILSLQHNRQKLSVTAEIVRRDIKLDDLVALPGPAFDASYSLEPMGYYLQGEYRLSKKWEAMARYDERMRNAPDRNGHDLGAATSLPRHYFFARDWTAGLRHNVNEHLGIWGEFHYVDGVAWVNPLDNASYNSGNADRYWTLFSLMIGLRF